MIMKKGGLIIAKKESVFTSVRHVKRMKLYPKKDDIINCLKCKKPNLRCLIDIEGWMHVKSEQFEGIPPVPNPQPSDKIECYYCKGRLNLGVYPDQYIPPPA